MRHAWRLKDPVPAVEAPALSFVKFSSLPARKAHSRYLLHWRSWLCWNAHSLLAAFVPRPTFASYPTRPWGSGSLIPNQHGDLENE